MLAWVLDLLGFAINFLLWKACSLRLMAAKVA
jgi:hypothetical protein